MQNENEGESGQPDRWFASINDERVGPMSLDELCALAARGELPKSSLVWHKGIAQWTEAGDVPDLEEAFRGGRSAPRRRTPEHRTQVDPMRRNEPPPKSWGEVGGKVGKAADGFALKAAEKARRAAEAYQAADSDQRNNYNLIIMASGFVLVTLGSFFVHYNPWLHMLLIVCWAFVGLIGLITMVASGSLMLRGRSLTLKSISVNPSPSNDVFVSLVGRTPGIIGWILAALGMDPIVNLHVTSRAVHVKTAGLAGEFRFHAPLAQISSTICGSCKPVYLILLGSVFITNSLMFRLETGQMNQFVRQMNGGYASYGGGGGFQLFIFLLIFGVGLLCLLAYWLKRKMLIHIETGGGYKLSWTFQRGFIENKAINLSDVTRAIQIINALVEHAQSTPAPEGTPAPKLQPVDPEEF